MEDELDEVAATQAVVIQAIRVPDRPSTGSMSVDRIPGTTKIGTSKRGESCCEIWGSQVGLWTGIAVNRGLGFEGLLVRSLCLVCRKIDDAERSCRKLLVAEWTFWLPRLVQDGGIDSR
jgi:hypothetical protein